MNWKRICSWVLPALLVTSIVYAAVGWKTDANGNFVKNGYTLSLPTIASNQTLQVESQTVPIGSIIPFYDFNAALTFDTDIWAYCDGSTKAVGSIGNQTLPDLSGRYLVGFGTDGGGDNDTAAWATASVGNASHQVSLAHTHDVNIGSFNSGSESSHTHDDGTYYTKMSSTSLGWLQVTSLTSWTENMQPNPPLNTGNDNTAHTDGIDIGGTSGAGSSHLHAVDPANTASTSAGSATQSIQPSSVRVRYIMRIQ